ncbi:MAG TPA: RNA polymerase sigma factor [Longimicrobiales bacterium]
MTTQTREPGTVGSDADNADVLLSLRGDARAFERLYRRHVARIHSLARRMLGDGEADEATQDAFIRAWNRLGTFRGDAAFGTWLYRVALNVVLSRRASLARRRRRFVQDDAAMRTAEQTTARPDLRTDLEAALARLPAGAREVFVLHDVEGFKHDEIAGMLGVTRGTSKSQLHRARMLLRAELAG